MSHVFHVCFTLCLALWLAPRPAAADEQPAWRFFASADEGLAVRRTDGTFGVKAGILAQTRYQARWLHGELEDNQFVVNIVRPTLNINLLRPWIVIFVQPELAGTPRLLDLEVSVQPIPAIGLKAGQFVTPFSRTFMTPVPKLLFPGFSIADNVFRGDRDTGLMVFGEPLRGRLEYFVGLFNGNGIGRGANDNHELSYYARLAGTVVGEAPPPNGHVHYDETPAVIGKRPLTLQLGINGYYNKTSPTVQVVDPMTQQLTARPLASHKLWTGGFDLQFRIGYLVLQGEVFFRHDTPAGAEPIWSVAGYVHGNIFLIPRWLELGARASFIAFNLDRSDQRLDNYEIQLATYPMDNHLKLLAAYVLTNVGAATLGYPAGLNHTFVAHAQVWF